MFSKKNKKNVIKGFTLIEMLIVIVIIGILAAAIFPKLWSARGRANDVARKADLSQTATAIVAYQIDHGSFPTWSWALINIKENLISAGINSIPSDPNTSRSFSWIGTSIITDGQYGYTPITKWWISGNAFVLMAATETPWWSNRVYTWNITNTIHYEDIILCKSITESNTGTANNNWVCTYKKWEDVLRYIYLY